MNWNSWPSMSPSLLYYLIHVNPCRFYFCPLYVNKLQPCTKWHSSEWPWWCLVQRPTLHISRAASNVILKFDSAWSAVTEQNFVVLTSFSFFSFSFNQPKHKNRFCSSRTGWHCDHLISHCGSKVPGASPISSLPLFSPLFFLLPPRRTVSSAFCIPS